MTCSPFDMIPKEITDEALALRKQHLSWDEVCAQLEAKHGRKFYRSTLSRSIKRHASPAAGSPAAWTIEAFEVGFAMRRAGVKWADIAARMTEILGRPMDEVNVKLRITNTARKRGIDINPAFRWTDDLRLEVVVRREQGEAFTTIAADISARFNRHIAPQSVWEIHRRQIGRPKPEPVPAPVAERFVPPRIVYHHPFAEMLGEPPAGRSALDQKRGAA